MLTSYRIKTSPTQDRTHTLFVRSRARSSRCCGLVFTQVKNIWLGCCAPGSFMTVWRQPEAPFICIRPIPLSCALRNSAFGLRVRVISKHTYIPVLENEINSRRDRNSARRSSAREGQRMRLRDGLRRANPREPHPDSEQPSANTESYKQEMEFQRIPR